VTQLQRKRLQDIIIEIEADAMPLGFEARQCAHRSAEKIRDFLRDFDTLPAPPLSSVPPAEASS